MQLIMRHTRTSRLARHAVAEVDDSRAEGAGPGELEIHPARALGKERNATANQHRADPGPVLVDQTQRGRLGGENNLNTHISAAMRTFIEAHSDWLIEARLPAYARDLNAVEGAWANMKNGLGNLAASDVGQLTAIVKNRLKRIQYPACPPREVLKDAAPRSRIRGPRT